jgi:choline dehydrogenase
VRIRVRREVVLCAGAVDSPRLLLLSGVGPAAELEQVGVKVVADLPGVGRSLRDHVHVPVCYRVPQGVKPHSHSNICEGTLFTKLDRSSPFASDLQVHVGTIFFEPDGFTPLGQGFTLTPSLIHPRSVGHLRLASSDPEDRPVIVANYLREREDLDTLVKGVAYVRALGGKMLDLLAQDAGGRRGEEQYPGPAVQGDANVEAYVRQFCGSMYHPACSARLGADGDEMAVLDPKMQVRGGIKGVRVIDASAMPDLIGANTNATCIALGEKGAQIIVDDHIWGDKADRR